MIDPLTRRRFFQALAVSALAAGAGLPVGFPKPPGEVYGLGPGVVALPDVWFYIGKFYNVTFTETVTVG